MALLNFEWLIFNKATQSHDGQFDQYFYLYNCASLQKGCLTTTCKAYPIFKEAKNPLCSNLTIKIVFQPLLSEPIPPPVVHGTCPREEGKGTSI